MRGVNLIYEQAVHGDAIETEYEPYVHFTRSVSSEEETLDVKDGVPDGLQTNTDSKASIQGIDDDERETMGEEEAGSIADDEDRDRIQKDEKPFDEDLEAERETAVEADTGEEAEAIDTEKHLVFQNRSCEDEAERAGGVEEDLGNPSKTDQGETMVNGVLKCARSVDSALIEHMDSNSSMGLSEFTSKNDLPSNTEGVEGIPAKESSTTVVEKHDKEVGNAASIVLENSETDDTSDSSNCDDGVNDGKRANDNETAGVRYIESEESTKSGGNDKRDEDAAANEQHATDQMVASGTDNATDNKLVTESVKAKMEDGKDISSQDSNSLLLSALCKISQLEQAYEQKKNESKAANERLVILEKHVLDQCSSEETKSKAFQTPTAQREEDHMEEPPVDKWEKMYMDTKELLQHEEKKTLNLRSALMQNEKAEEETLSRLSEMEKQLAVAKERASQEASRANDLQNSLQATEELLEKQKVQLELLEDERKKNEAIRSNVEIMEALEKSNAARQKLIDEEKAKIAELEEKKFEKEILFEAHQRSVKIAEEALARYHRLIEAEQAKVQELELLENQRKEKVKHEEDQIHELEGVLARKNALLELERIKKQTLEKAIAEKDKMIETETLRLKEYRARCLEKERMVKKEQEIVKSIAVVVKEKEHLLATEQDVVQKLFQTIEEKKALKKQEKLLASGIHMSKQTIVA
eukprot:scaffold1482_cov120-Cylindrotheca_fusiformis.AAC.23